MANKAVEIIGSDGGDRSKRIQMSRSLLILGFECTSTSVAAPITPDVISASGTISLQPGPGSPPLLAQLSYNRGLDRADPSW